MNHQHQHISIEEYQALTLLFKVFADSTRLRIFNLLKDGEHSVLEIASELEMSQSAVSHQLATLKQTNLVKYEKRGQQVFYALKDSHVMMIFNQALEHVRE